MNEPRIPVTGRLILGLAVIALGILFMLDNLRLVDAVLLLRWSPLLLSAYGVVRMTGHRGRRSTTIGALFVIFGVWFTLGNFGLIRFELWPVLLIFIGALMVARSLGSRAADVIGDSASRLSAFAMWSGTERRVVSHDFRGGEITAIMGGHDIDLREAQPADGPVVIDLLVIMGGVDIRVPEAWRVSLEALPLLGGVEDHSKAPHGEARGQLVLKGLVLMGGVEVKN